MCLSSVDQYASLFWANQSGNKIPIIAILLAQVGDNAHRLNCRTERIALKKAMPDLFGKQRACS
jgi:hypothetical protein